MSNKVQVDIHTSNDVRAGSLIPRDYDIQQAIDELVDGLELAPAGSDGRPIEYRLYSFRTESYLDPAGMVATLLRDGDEIRLVAGGNNHAVPEPEPPLREPPTIPEDPDDIRVSLYVIDLNRREDVSFSMKKPVGEIIRDILRNYNRPSHDEMGNPIDYRLESKALGKFLLPGVTLADADIPPMDLLTLHTKAIAG